MHGGRAPLKSPRDERWTAIKSQAALMRGWIAGCCSNILGRYGEENVATVRSAGDCNSLQEVQTSRIP